MASGSKETREARTRAFSEIAKSPARAVSACFVSITIQGISARGAFLELAGGSTVSSVTQATNMLHGIPRSIVCTGNLRSQMLLRPTGTAIIAVVVAHGTLASDTIVTREAVTCTGGAVTAALVGALRPRMKIVSIHNFSYPGKVLGTGSL